MIPLNIKINIDKTNNGENWMGYKLQSSICKTITSLLKQVLLFFLYQTILSCKSQTINVYFSSTKIIFKLYIFMEQK